MDMPTECIRVIIAFDVYESGCIPSCCPDGHERLDLHSFPCPVIAAFGVLKFVLY